MNKYYELSRGSDVTDDEELYSESISILKGKSFLVSFELFSSINLKECIKYSPKAFIVTILLGVRYNA